MYFQIKEIILWPRIKGLEPRRLPFLEGKVNVITGASRTGKSAIIPIVDYCLGASDCFIPVDTIRNACEWFGVLVQTKNKQILFARREPGSQKVSGDMYVLQGNEVEIPAVIDQKNIYFEDVKALLNDLAGVPSFRLDGEETQKDFKSRPSFRDLMAFNFQPQNIVANQNVLFYKADTYEHRERLRYLFPYALGAITPELLAIQHELKTLQNDLKRKEKELQRAKDLSVRWISEIKTHISMARELGLLDGEISISDSPDDLILLLKQITTNKDVKPRISEGNIVEALNELNQLRNHEKDLSMELSRFRARLNEMNRLRDTVSQYREMTGLKRDRLKISDWIIKAHVSDGVCPVCHGNIKEAHEEILSLQEALRRFENESQAYLDMPAAFEREYENVRQDIRNKSEELNALQSHRQKIEVSSAELQKEHYLYSNALRFIGNVERAIETYEAVGDDGELVSEIEELRNKVHELKEKVSEKNIQEKINRTLKQISNFAAGILPHLDVEDLYKSAPCALSINDLAIKITVENGQEHYLWELGSGSNWVSYHIAITIALHKLFANQTHSPIAGFIFYDQPSQVYFPKKLAITKTEDGYDPKLTDEDVTAVRKIFEALSNAIKTDTGKWQVIILDHASQDVWGDIPDVHLVEEWRDGKKLIPLSWIGVDGGNK